MSKKYQVKEVFDGKAFVVNTQNPNHIGEWVSVEDIAVLNGEAPVPVVSTPEEIAAMLAEMDADWDASNA